MEWPLLGSREAWAWLRDGLLVWPEVTAQAFTLVVARLLRFVSWVFFYFRYVFEPLQCSMHHGRHWAGGELRGPAHSELKFHTPFIIEVLGQLQREPP